MTFTLISTETFSDLNNFGIYDSGVNAPNDPRLAIFTSVSNSVLQLKIDRDPVSHLWAGSGVAHSFNQLYGAWEVEVCVSVGSGASAVFLLWPQSEVWDDGEIDIFETGGDSSAQSFTGFVHNIPSATNQQATSLQTLDMATWHTFRVEWTPGQIIYYMNGTPYGSFSGSIVPTTPMHACIQLDQKDGTPTQPVLMQCRALRVFAYSVTPTTSNENTLSLSPPPNYRNSGDGGHVGDHAQIAQDLAFLLANQTPVAGPRGASVLGGTSDPGSGTGLVGDFYINTASVVIFGPKTSSGWGAGTSLRGTGLTGATGPAGATGAPGPQGPQGTQGFTGPSVRPPASYYAFGDSYIANDGLEAEKPSAGRIPQVAAQLGMSGTAITNRGIGGTNIFMRRADWLADLSIPTRTGPAGLVWPAEFGPRHMHFGPNDFAAFGSGSTVSSAVMARIVDEIHTYVCESRMSVLYTPSVAPWSSIWSVGGAVSNAGYNEYYSNTVGAVSTFTVPSGVVDGQYLDFTFCRQASSTAGGTLTVGGTATSASGTVDLTGGAAGIYLETHTTVRKQLLASDAGKTFTFTVATVESGGYLFIGNAYLESTNPPLFILENQPKLPTTGVTAIPSCTSTNVNTFNGSLATKFAGFDSSLQLIDVDVLLGANPVFFGASGVHQNEQGHYLIAQQIKSQYVTALSTLDSRTYLGQHPYRDKCKFTNATYLGPTLYLDPSSAEEIEILLDMNVTGAYLLRNPAGSLFRLTFIQDSTGGRTAVWPSNCDFAGGSAPTIATGAGKLTTVLFRFDRSGSRAKEISRSTNV